MSRASRNARYYARKKETAAALQDFSDVQSSKIFLLEERLKTLEEENRRLREALLRHGVQQ